MPEEYTGVADRPSPARRESLARRLARRGPLILDGATGTELERRGVHCGLPLWSTHALLEAPSDVAEVHQAYREAGCDILTANTFRTQRRTLESGGLGARASQLTTLAVELARNAGADFVAGSAPPLEDCYRPDLVPDESDLEREHREHAENLALAGVDLILIETMNCIREAVVAARAAADTGLPYFVSFVSWTPGTLLSGERLVDGLNALRPLAPLALLVNCLPPSAVPPAMSVLEGSGLPFGVYANLGHPLPDGSFEATDSTSPSAFAAHAASWATAGACIIGGCCGTTPEHMAAAAEAARKAR